MSGAKLGLQAIRQTTFTHILVLVGMAHLVTGKCKDFSCLLQPCSEGRYWLSEIRPLFGPGECYVPLEDNKQDVSAQNVLGHW